ncbi:MAG: ABC transporter ATP-binding protein [Candidatus Thermoplasmatota archaeon]|nr:ABC transporter ATP-binding protein [Candidatus Thermoplasmatota archaeon]MBS3817819.1 ABC transporter ATP-binding protein [Candidatus Thermoplasmatota archaeon]
MRGGFGRRIRSDNEEDFSLKQLDKRALKFILKYLKEHKVKMILAILSMLMMTLASLAGPFLIKIAIDEYIMVGDLEGLTFIFFMMVGAYGAYWLFSYFQTYLSNWIGHTIVGDIREDLYEHLQGLPIDFYNKHSTGDMMARVTHDVNALSDLVSTGFVHLLSDFFVMIGIVVIMLYLNVELALVSFIVIPFIFFVVYYLGKKMRMAYRDVRERLAELNADVEQNLSGIRLVQALNRENINTGKFSKLSWKNLKANLKAATYFSLLFPIMTLSKVFGEALVLGYGGWGIVQGAVSLGVLIAFMDYVRRFFGPLADMSQVYNTYQSAGASLDRIYEYISEESEIKEAEKTESPEKIEGKIEFQNVSFSYDEEMIIDELDLKIKSSEIFALVGQTGAGKTTIVNILTRLYDVDEGRITVDGIDLRNYPKKRLREIISVVPQDIFLFDTSIKENIRFGRPKASDEEIVEVAKKVHAHDFIEGLPESYETRVGEGGVKLSGGQKQLVSFARAMLADPKILILDEATSSVDAYTEVLIQDAMEKLLEGRTVLMIAHRFATLDRADRIGILKEGRLIDTGSHEELMESNETYRRLYEKQKGR